MFTVNFCLQENLKKGEQIIGYRNYQGHGAL